MDDGSASVAASPGDGSVFACRYRLIHLLGEGDRKRTFLAEDTVVPRQVALAIIKPEAAGLDPRGTTREVEAICQTGNHDNIVTLYDRGIAEGADWHRQRIFVNGSLLLRRNHVGSHPAFARVPR